MVQVGHETTEETHTRLCKVIVEAHFKVYEGTFIFEEFPLTDFHSKARENALALVRDDDIWSQLVACKDESQELFSVFSFHFIGGTDNSGFVGWFASHLKKQLGTSVFVTCGQNNRRGGIFDYWGVPSALSEKAIEEVYSLRNQAQS